MVYIIKFENMVALYTTVLTLLKINTVYFDDIIYYFIDHK